MLPEIHAVIEQEQAVLWCDDKVVKVLRHTRYFENMRGRCVRKRGVDMCPFVELEREEFVKLVLVHVGFAERIERFAVLSDTCTTVREQVVDESRPLWLLDTQRIIVLDGDPRLQRGVREDRLEAVICAEYLVM